MNAYDFIESRQWFFASAFATVIGLVALANLGCATTLASKYPHFDRRPVCVLPPGIEQDATEFIITDNNIPISNFHPEVVDRVAADVRTVFEYDPDARPDSVRDLPAPYNELTCRDRFSPLPSKDAETPPLPEAAIDLLVHEPRPEILPRAIAEKLASCPSPSSDKLKPIEHTMRFNVYVTNDGRAVSALVAQSTIEDRRTETCLVNALRGTSWPELAAPLPRVAAAPAPLASKLFVADGPPNLPTVTDLWKQIQKGPTPSVGTPPGTPTQVRLPTTFIVTLPLRLIVGTGVFVTISLWPRNTAPRCADELNPITRLPYTSIEECEQVLRLTPEQIAQLQQALIKATGPQAPPAPVPKAEPPPPPSPPPQDPPRRDKPDKCPKIKQEIDDLIKTVRDKTSGDFPQGYQGLAKRWEEYATNEGKWGYTPEGNLGKKAENHIKEYRRHQERLKGKLDEWASNQCKEKGHTLPDNAGQYAAQEPQLGPGKPLGPAPKPIYEPATSPTVIVPQPRKPSK